jgi:hypothetical protein
MRYMICMHAGRGDIIEEDVIRETMRHMWHRCTIFDAARNSFEWVVRDHGSRKLDHTISAV